MEYIKCETAQKPTSDNKINNCLTKTGKWSDNATIIIYAPVHTGMVNVCKFKLLFALCWIYLVSSF